MASRAQDAAVPGVTLNLIEWLVSERCCDLDDAGLIAELGTRLNALGLPVDRLTLHLRTLHPEIFGRTIAWAPDEPVEIRDRSYGVLTAKIFVGSPLWKVMETRQRAVIRAGGKTPQPWLEIDVFRNRRLAEFVMVPLVGASGPASAICFATRSERGFSANNLAVMHRIAPALRSLCELRTLRQTDLALLDTLYGAAAE